VIVVILSGRSNLPPCSLIKIKTDTATYTLSVTTVRAQFHHKLPRLMLYPTILYIALGHHKLSLIHLSTVL